MKTRMARGWLVLLALVLFLAMFSWVRFPVPGAYAGTAKVNFDETDPLDDLRSGENFNLLAYPFDESESIRIANFVEYCYSFRVNLQKNYGLYLYFYNPQGLEIDTTNAGNQVQLAVRWDEKGIPTDYETFALRYCSRSEESTYLGLFYKFKIVDRMSADGKTILERVNSTERRYDVSGFYLTIKGEMTARPFKVGGTYQFSGYSKGYGPDPDAESTLKSTFVNDLETVILNVQHAFWRDGNASSKLQNQLDSIYFSVPEKLFKKYGKLQKVKLEWYEYRTSPIVVVRQTKDYQTLLPYVGKVIGDHDASLSLGFGTNQRSSSTPTMGENSRHYDWSYNVKQGGSYPAKSSDEICEQLTYLFCSDGEDLQDYFLSGETLRSWIYDYQASAEKGYLPIKDGSLSADLFTGNVGANRVQGYNCLEVDSDAKFDMLANDDRSWWDRFWGINVGTDFRNIAPIVEVPDGGLTANGMYVDAHLLNELQSYRSAAASRNERTMMIRFAVTDYWSEKVVEDALVQMDFEGFVAQENVFLDLKVIQLTFNKEGKYHVIAAVANPIDAVGGITPPPPEKTGCDGLKTLFGTLLLLVLLVLLAPLLPYVLKFLWWIICLPFKAVAAIVKAVKPNQSKK